MFDPNNFSLIIEPETIAEAQATVSNFLRIPDHANRKGDPTKPGGYAFFTQFFKVIDVTVNPITDGDRAGELSIRVECQVPEDILPDDINIGKRHSAWFSVWPAALADKNHEKRKRTMFNLGRLRGMLAACGADIPDGAQIDFAAFLAARDGSPAWLVGKRFAGVVKHSWYEGKQKQEITDYAALTD